MTRERQLPPVPAQGTMLISTWLGEVYDWLEEVRGILQVSEVRLEDADDVGGKLVAAERGQALHPLPATIVFTGPQCEHQIYNNAGDGTFTCRECGHVLRMEDLG